MTLSEVELLVAAQSGGDESKQHAAELWDRCKALLTYYACRMCRTVGLDLSEAEDIVQYALVALLDPETAHFDADRGENWRTYLLHLIQNATRVHTRSLRRGDTVRHSYTDPDNERRNLPISPADIADSQDDFAEAEDQEEATKVAAVVMLLATPEVRALLQGIYFRNLTPEKVGETAGINRTTVGRRINRFFAVVRASQALARLIGRAGDN